MAKKCHSNWATHPPSGHLGQWCGRLHLASWRSSPTNSNAKLPWLLQKRVEELHRNHGSQVCFLVNEMCAFNEA